MVTILPAMQAPSILCASEEEWRSKIFSEHLVGFEICSEDEEAGLVTVTTLQGMRAPSKIVADGAPYQQHHTCGDLFYQLRN